LISASVEKSKAYYFMTYAELPKKPVLNDVMLKLFKNGMPFAVVVGDQPVYTRQRMSTRKSIKPLFHFFVLFKLKAV